MKLFLKYLNGRLPIYATFLLFGIIFAVSFSLYHLPITAVVYPYILCVVAGIILTVVDFRRIKERHKTLTAIKSITDAIETALPEQRDIESDDYKEIIRLICDEHKAFRTKSNKNYYDMVDYYTVAGSEMYNHWLPIFTVFLGTGCRVGEIIGLRWKDCDFQNGVININHNLIYRMQDSGKCEFHITTPKTAAGCRNVPMLDEVREALSRERLRQFQQGYCIDEIDGYSGFCFSNKLRHIHSPHALNRALERIRLACNEQEAERAKKERREPIVIPHFSVHNLRHTFCTRFCENETNIKVIQEIMGHADIETTMNVYAEATESKKKESFEHLQGKIKIC